MCGTNCTQSIPTLCSRYALHVLFTLLTLCCIPLGMPLVKLPPLASVAAQMKDKLPNNQVSPREVPEGGGVQRIKKQSHGHNSVVKKQTSAAVQHSPGCS